MALSVSSYGHHLPKCGIMKFNHQINKMLNKPVIDSEFGEVLDNFLHQLNETQKYLSSGIFNVKFAEAGLFLQNSTAIYGKRVDLLWDSAMKFQMQLCSLNNSPEGNSEETARIKHRINRSKREKIITDDFLQESDSNKMINISEKFKILECSSLQINKSFLDRWKIKAKNELKTKTTNRNCFPNKISTLVHFPINSDIYEVNSGEKLCNYKDTYLNSAVLNLFSNRCKDDLDCSKIGDFSHGDDWLLQRYLKEKNITYGQLWTDKLADNFDSFQKSCRKTENQEAIVNIERLPEQLMTAYVEDNYLHLNTMVRDILSIEKQREGMKGQQIRDRSDRISLADSAFHEESFSSDSSPTYNPQSLSDSGVFYDLPSSSLSECHESMFASANSENGEKDDFVDNGNLQADSVSNCTEIRQISPTMEVDKLTVSVITNCEKPSKQSVTGTNSEINVRTSTRIRKKVKIPVMVSDIEEENDAQIVQGCKRKLTSEHNLEKRRKVTFRWLKTTTAFLRTFENFFLRNYIPDVGEAEEHRILPFIPSDDETMSEASTNENGNVSDEESSISSENELTNIPNVQLMSECTDVNSAINGELIENEQLDEIVNQEHITDQISTIELDNSINVCQELALKSVKRLESVAQWRKFIEPKLEALEKVPPFDIHEYGTHILNVIPVDENLSFKNLVKNRPPSEVCRLFMATLQLTNTYNVELIAGNQGELATNSLELKLLTKDRYHEHLDVYEAPSEQNFIERLQQVQACSSTQIHSTPNRHQSKRQKLSYS